MSEEVEKQETELKPKMKLFADFYLGEALFNGTQAARLAKYTGDDNTLAVTASRLLRNAKVSAYIEQKLETYGMGANEVIARLAEHARGKITDVMNEDNEIDIGLAKKRNTDRLIKKLKIKRSTKIVSELDENGEKISDLESSILHEQIEFEIHDPQSALEKIGRFHKLFTDKIEHGGEVGLKHSVVRVPPKMSPEEWNKQQSDK